MSHVSTLLASIRAAYGKDQATEAQVVGLVSAAVLFARNAGASTTIATVKAEALAGTKSTPSKWSARGVTLAVVEYILATAADAGARPNGDNSDETKKARSAAAEAYAAAVGEWITAYKASKPAPTVKEVTREALESKVAKLAEALAEARAELAEFDAKAREVAAAAKAAAEAAKGPRKAAAVPTPAEVAAAVEEAREAREALAERAASDALAVADRVPMAA